ncbi:hypothetical protein H8959_001920 [Pygathrix nigripes]
MMRRQNSRNCFPGASARGQRRVPRGPGRERAGDRGARRSRLPRHLPEPANFAPPAAQRTSQPSGASAIAWLAFPAAAEERRPGDSGCSWPCAVTSPSGAGLEAAWLGPLGRRPLVPPGRAHKLLAARDPGQTSGGGAAPSTVTLPRASHQNRRRGRGEEPACGAPPVSRGARAPRAAGAGSVIGAPPPGAGLWAACGEAAGGTRAATATATATAGSSGPGSRAGEGDRRRAQPPEPREDFGSAGSPSAPSDSGARRRVGPGTGEEDPGPCARAPGAAGVRTSATVGTLGAWLSALLFTLPSSLPRNQSSRPPPPSCAHPPPPGSGPARTQHHEETWDLPGDFGRTFANCGGRDLLRLGGCHYESLASCKRNSRKLCLKFPVAATGPPGVVAARSPPTPSSGRAQAAGVRLRPRRSPGPGGRLGGGDLPVSCPPCRPLPGALGDRGRSPRSRSVCGEAGGVPCQFQREGSAPAEGAGRSPGPGSHGPAPRWAPPPPPPSAPLDPPSPPQPPLPPLGPLAERRGQRQLVHPARLLGGSQIDPGRFAAGLSEKQLESASLLLLAPAAIRSSSLAAGGSNLLLLLLLLPPLAVPLYALATCTDTQVPNLGGFHGNFANDFRKVEKELPFI